MGMLKPGTPNINPWCSHYMEVGVCTNAVVVWVHHVIVIEVELVCAVAVVDVALGVTVTEDVVVVVNQMFNSGR